MTSTPPSDVGGSAASRATVASIAAAPSGPSLPERELARQVHAVDRVERVELVEQGSRRGLAPLHEVAHREGRRHAVFVGDRVAHRVAEGLLIGEDQPLAARRAHAAEPLEAGERLCERHVVVRRDLRQQARRDDRRRDEPVLARGAPAAVLAEDRPELVPRERPPPARERHRDAAAVRVGVVGDDEVGAHRGAEREDEVHRAGLLGVGERHGREVGVGVGLLGDEADVEPRASEQAGHDRAADAVQGRVGDAQVVHEAVRLDEPLDRRGVRLDEPRVVEDRDRPVLGRPRRRRRREPSRRRLDLLVGGRDDLGTVVVVDLVAVVARGVVAGGHDHARGRAEVTDREGGERRRQRSVEDMGGDAGAGQDVHGVVGELGRAVPRVPADDHPCGRRPGSLACDPVPYPGGGPAHHEAVHRRGASADDAAQPGRAEREGVVEALVERARVAGLEERRELGARHLVGVLGDPLGDRAHEPGVKRCGLGAHSRSITPRRRRPSPGAAAAPAASTSWWSSGVGETPAARFVTSESPSTSAPRCRAAIASRAVDIPTRSAPRVRSIRISAGVS